MTFDAGTICLATKVLMVVYPPEKKHEKSLFEKFKDYIFCKNTSKIKFEVAIEFKIVRDFNQLINTVFNDRKKSMHIFNIDLKQIEKLRNDYSSSSFKSSSSNNSNSDDKYYYLPIYHDPNDTIDLIPIASTNCLQLNSLQNIFNLMQRSDENKNKAVVVLENPIRVRVRVENLFNKLQNLTTAIPFTSQTSFYEIYERKKSSKFLVGYNLKREKFVLYAIDNEKSNSVRLSYELIEQKIVEMIYDRESLNKLVNVKINSFFNDFLASFQHNIHKIELDYVRNANGLSINDADDDGYVSCKNTKVKNQFIMHWRRKNEYKTFPKARYLKADKLLISGRTNNCFIPVTEIDANNNKETTLEFESNQRSRSKSLPNSGRLLSKSSFTNMSLIIEQDETKKTKV